MGYLPMFLTTIIWAALGPALALQISEPVAKDTVIENLKRYEAALRDIEFRLSGESTSDPRRNLYTFRIQLRDTLFVEERTMKPGETPRERVPYEILCGSNSKYAFRAGRQLERDKRAVTSVDSSTQYLRSRVTDLITQSAYFPFALREKTISEWLATPGFSILDAHRQISETGKPEVLVKVSYANSVRDPRTDAQVPFEGLLFLDPNRKWGIQRFELIVTFRYTGEADRKCLYDGTCAYSGSLDGNPIPKETTHLYRDSPASPVRTRLAWQIHDLRRASSDESDYSLSAFGLEEPWGVIWPQPPTPWFLYFSAGGFGLFFLALFLWRVLAKRQARGAA
jgi:hypothetical protein